MEKEVAQSPIELSEKEKRKYLFLKQVNTLNAFRERNAISKEQYEKNEAEGFVESKFGGSLKNFLVAFRGSDKISKNDIEDLKAWLDEFDD